MHYIYLWQCLLNWSLILFSSSVRSIFYTAHRREVMRYHLYLSMCKNDSIYCLIYFTWYGSLKFHPYFLKVTEFQSLSLIKSSVQDLGILQVNLLKAPNWHICPGICLIRIISLTVFIFLLRCNTSFYN